MTTTQEQASGARRREDGNPQCQDGRLAGGLIYTAELGEPRPQDELSGFWYEGGRSFWKLVILHNKSSNDLLHVNLLSGVLPKPRIPAVAEEEQC